MKVIHTSATTPGTASLTASLWWVPAASPSSRTTSVRHTACYPDVFWAIGRKCECYNGEFLGHLGTMDDPTRISLRKPVAASQNCSLVYAVSRAQGRHGSHIGEHDNVTSPAPSRLPTNIPMSGRASALQRKSCSNHTTAASLG